MDDFFFSANPWQISKARMCRHNKVVPSISKKIHNFLFQTQNHGYTKTKRGFRIFIVSLGASFYCIDPFFEYRLQWFLHSHHLLRLPLPLRLRRQREGLRFNVDERLPERSDWAIEVG